MPHIMLTCEFVAIAAHPGCLVMRTLPSVP